MKTFKDKPLYTIPAMKALCKKKQRLQRKGLLYIVTKIELQNEHIRMNSASLKRRQTNSPEFRNFVNSRRKNGTNLKIEVSVKDLNTYFATFSPMLIPEGQLNTI